MFDLNELPQDDDDMLPCHDDVACVQSASNSKACCMQVKEPETSFFRPCCEVGDGKITIDHATMPVHLADLAPLPLGQHPLSCFRPFVRSNRELSNGTVLTAKEGDVGFENLSSKQTREAALVNSFSRGCTGDQSNGHHILGPQDCDEIVQRQKPENILVLPNNSIDLQGTLETSSSSTIVQVSEEVQERAPLRSALVDGSAKTDVSRGVSSTVEGKLPSSFVKRSRLDQKDAMLGKKRARQTMYLDVREAAKQAPPPKASTVKKSSPLPSFRNYKEAPKTPVASCAIDVRPKDTKSSNPPSDGYKGTINSLGSFEGIVTDGQMKLQGLAMKIVSSTSDEVVEGVSLAAATTLARHSSLKGDVDEKGEGPQLTKPSVGRHPEGSQGKLDGEVKPASYVRPLAKKNFNNYRKQSLYSQDSSIERLHREATCEKLWKSAAATSMLSPVERGLCVCILLQFHVAITWSRQCLLMGKITANGA